MLSIRSRSQWNVALTKNHSFSVFFYCYFCCWLKWIQLIIKMFSSFIFYYFVFLPFKANSTAQQVAPLKTINQSFFFSDLTRFIFTPSHLSSRVFSSVWAKQISSILNYLVLLLGYSISYQQQQQQCKCSLKFYSFASTSGT